MSETTSSTTTKQPTLSCRFCDSMMTYEGTVGLDDLGQHVEEWYCPECKETVKVTARKGLEAEPNIQL